MRLSGLERARLERATHRDSLAQAAMGKHILNMSSKFMSLWWPQTLCSGSRVQPSSAKPPKDLSIPSPKRGQRAWKILDLFGAGRPSHTQIGFTDNLAALHDSITEEFALKTPDEGSSGVSGMATATFCRGFTGTGSREAALHHIPPGFTHGGCTFQVLLCPMLGERGSLPAFSPSFTLRDHLEQPLPAVPGHVGFTLQVKRVLLLFHGTCSPHCW